MLCVDCCAGRAKTRGTVARWPRVERRSCGDFSGAALASSREFLYHCIIVIIIIVSSIIAIISYCITSRRIEDVDEISAEDAKDGPSPGSERRSASRRRPLDRSPLLTGGTRGLAEAPYAPGALASLARLREISDARARSRPCACAGERRAIAEVYPRACEL